MMSEKCQNINWVIKEHYTWITPMNSTGTRWFPVCRGFVDTCVLTRNDTIEAYKNSKSNEKLTKAYIDKYALEYLVANFVKETPDSNIYSPAYWTACGIVPF